MTMDTSGTLRESLSRMLWSRGGLSSNSSWKTARSHALNHHSKPTRFLVNQYPLKEVFKSYESSWKSNNENQGFWQERCPVEVEGLQWACGLRLVGTCYIEIGKGSPEPREAYPCSLHVTTWDFFLNIYRSTLSILNWGPNFQSAAPTGFHCSQVLRERGASEDWKCWPVFATCLKLWISSIHYYSDSNVQIIVDTATLQQDDMHKSWWEV